MSNYEDFVVRCNSDEHAPYNKFVGHEDKNCNLPPLPSKEFFENNGIELIDFVIGTVAIQVDVDQKHNVEQVIKDTFDAIYTLTPTRGFNTEAIFDPLVAIKVRGRLNASKQKEYDDHFKK